MSYVSKKILKSRKKKRLEKIKKFLNGAKTPAEVKKLVELDWQKAEYFGVGKRDFVKILHSLGLIIINRSCSISSIAIIVY